MSSAPVQLLDFRPKDNTMTLDHVERVIGRYVGPDHPDAVHRLFSDHLETGGKRLRARIALAAGRALGVWPDSVCSWAAAVEVMHNATLIHDDIQDGDRMRRGRPTTWALHGVGQAINVGDFGLMVPFVIVNDMDAKPRVRSELSGLIARRGIRAAQGQHLSLSMLAARRFNRHDYLQCVSGTTGAFFTLPVEGCALLAGYWPDDAQALGRCFKPLGTLFQVQDDVLDLFGDKGRDEAGNDLRDGKVSALVVRHLEMRPADASWLVPLLERERHLTSNADVERATEAFEKSGALHGCLQDIDDLVCEIADNPLLEDHPAFRSMALNCVELALRPIEGIR